MRHERKPVVTFITRILPHYRIPFHERVRALLDERGVEYRLIHGQPNPREAAKGDLATVPWAIRVGNRAIPGRDTLVWQPVLGAALSSDLIVVGQENQLLVNYPLQLLPRAVRPMLALWGHGRNFQSREPGSRAERWKRWWATRCDWWFAYTEETRRHVESLGFPADRITVVNNAVDTGELARLAAEIGPDEQIDARSALGIAAETAVGIFVGGLYPDKRLDFLVAAAERTRALVPDFSLLVVGGGTDRPKLEALAADRPWLIVAGPRFGREKVALMQGAQLFLMPGLVGLAVLDAATLGLPVVTTAFPYHSPEIAYLREGAFGEFVSDWTNADSYGQAVAMLLLDPERRIRLAERARACASHYSIEAMAVRFADGASLALRTAGLLHLEAKPHT